MAAAVPSSEPTTIIAGDTIPWTKSLPDYLASDGWILSYAFRLENGAGVQDVIAVTLPGSTTDFSASITATQSAAMKPGTWVFAAYVTKGSERYRIAAGTVVVLPNLAKVDSSTDLRSPAKRAFDNAQAAWEAVKLGQTVTLNGRTYSQHNLTSLITYVDRCRSDYNLEVAAQQQEATGQNPRHIGVRLSRV